MGQASYVSLAASPSGVPYTAYSDGGQGQMAVVMSFDGTKWNQVGSTGASTSAASYISLALSNGITPFVAYSDGSAAGNGKASLMYFNGSWNQYSGLYISSGVATYLSLAFDGSGNPYVGYNDVPGGVVSYYISPGWLQLGNRPFTNIAVAYVSLAYDTADNAPYVAYSMGNEGFVSWSSSWFLMDGTYFAVPVSNISLAVSNTMNVYAAYCDSAGDPCMAYYSNNQLLNYTLSASSQCSNTSIALRGGLTPYVAFSDGSKLGSVTVMYFSNNQFYTVGQPGFSSGPAGYVSLAFDGSGIPYVAFSDGSLGGRITVMAYK